MATPFRGFIPAPLPELGLSLLIATSALAAATYYRDGLVSPGTITVAPRVSAWEQGGRDIPIGVVALVRPDSKVDRSFVLGVRESLRQISDPDGVTLPLVAVVSDHEEQSGDARERGERIFQDLEAIVGAMGSRQRRRRPVPVLGPMTSQGACALLHGLRDASPPQTWNSWNVRFLLGKVTLDDFGDCANGSLRPGESRTQVERELRKLARRFFVRTVPPNRMLAAAMIEAVPAVSGQQRFLLVQRSGKKASTNQAYLDGLRGALEEALVDSGSYQVAKFKPTINDVKQTLVTILAETADDVALLVVGERRTLEAFIRAARQLNKDCLLQRVHIVGADAWDQPESTASDLGRCPPSFVYVSTLSSDEQRKAASATTRDDGSLLAPYLTGRSSGDIVWTAVALGFNLHRAAQVDEEHGETVVTTFGPMGAANAGEMTFNWSVPDGEPALSNTDGTPLFYGCYPLSSAQRHE